MANNPERDCSMCKYGDNGSNHEGCSRVEEAFLYDEPWPFPDVLAKLISAAKHLLDDHSCDGHGHEEVRVAIGSAERIVLNVRELEQRFRALEKENERLSDVCSLASQRLRFALKAFETPPRPPFRVTPEPREPKDARDTSNKRRGRPPSTKHLLHHPTSKLSR